MREALASAFQNIYAEGYPDEETRRMSEAEILDYTARLGHFRRYSDPRYYKGVEYADMVEALARRRCAEAFAANGISADEIFVNVQALSGAPANNAVYHALVNPGDTIMGMNLLHGGHLSHGSSVNRSGKYYNAIHYTVDPKTEQIDYDQVEELASSTSPSSSLPATLLTPGSVDWARFQRDCQIGWRLPVCRYCPRRRAGGGGRLSFAGGLCRCDHLHHPQIACAARAAPAS